MTIPSKYSHCLVDFYNSKGDTTMYIGYGDNPNPKPPTPPTPPEPTSKTYILEYSGNSLYTNPSNNITSNDVVYVFKSVSMSKSASEPDFGYFPIMTKYS